MKKKLWRLFLFLLAIVSGYAIKSFGYDIITLEKILNWILEFINDLIKTDLFKSLIERKNLLYAGLTSIIALLIAYIDRICSKLTGKGSLLKINYTEINEKTIFRYWTSGAFIFALLGMYLEIFQANSVSTIAIGIGWPVMFSSLIDKHNGSNKDKNKNETIKEPDDDI